VRETVVRPLLHALGYKQFTANNIRTEVPLRYPNLFLGKKKRKDPPLRGKADYVCEVISHGRWVVEAKASNVEISRDDIEQAHSYSAHPEIRAIYFLVTNGRHFVVHAVSGPDEPILEWKAEEQQSIWVNLQNLLGPAAIVQRSKLVLPSPGKALTLGLRSEARIVGGMISYDFFDSLDPVFSASLKPFVGLRATVLGETVRRDPDGMIHGVMRLAGPNAEWDRINALVGYDKLEFRTSDEYISSDSEQPNIFQNVLHAVIPAGTHIKAMLGLPPDGVTLRFPVRCAAFTQAVGFFDGKRFSGFFEIEQAFELPEQARHFGMQQLSSFQCGGEAVIHLE